MKFHLPWEKKETSWQYCRLQCWQRGAKKGTIASPACWLEEAEEMDGDTKHLDHFRGIKSLKKKNLSKGLFIPLSEWVSWSCLGSGLQQVGTGAGKDGPTRPLPPDPDVRPENWTSGQVTVVTGGDEPVAPQLEMDAGVLRGAQGACISGGASGCFSWSVTNSAHPWVLLPDSGDPWHVPSQQALGHLGTLLKALNLHSKDQ